MSTTECITQTSLSPTKSPNRRRPDATGRDEQLRHADRQRLHRGRAEQAALGAAEAQHAVHAPVGELAHDDLAHALAHQRHGRAARARGPHVVELVPARARDRAPADVGRDRRLAEDPGVDHDGADAERRQAVAHVGDLVTLGVERADQRDRRHQIGRRRVGRECRAQTAHRVLGVAVVVGLGHGAGRVVAQELLHRDAAAGLRGVTDLGAVGDDAAVHRGDELDGHVAVVADAGQLADDRVPVERAVARGHPVVVGDVEVGEAVARGADRAAAGRTPRCSCGTRRARRRSRRRPPRPAPAPARSG